MTEPGLRSLKKARTRRLIAETAARLFAERGYEKVTVSEIARAAEVADQTLYNYFPTKEQLVTDDEQEIQQRLVDLIRHRPPGTSPAAAVREMVLGPVTSLADAPPEVLLGTIGSLAAISPAVHRLVLEMADRQATALAEAIADTSPVSPEVARLQGIALSGVIQISIHETGRRARAGQSPAEISRDLRPTMESLFSELERWLA
jgi:AcrR family transcriptional regulator